MKSMQATIIWSNPDKRHGLVYRDSVVIGKLTGSAWDRTELRYRSWTVGYTDGVSGVISSIPSVGLTRFEQGTLPSAIALMAFHYFASINVVLIEHTEQLPPED